MLYCGHMTSPQCMFKLTVANLVKPFFIFLHLYHYVLKKTLTFVKSDYISSQASYIVGYGIPYSCIMHFMANVEGHGGIPCIQKNVIVCTIYMHQI